MPIDVKKNQKKYVTDLRKKGLSYSEIGKELAIPKSTISLWLKKVKLTDAQLQRLSERRIAAARANSKKRKTTLEQKIEALKNESAQNIRQISKRELWLMGIMLYWRERLAIGSPRGDQKNIQKRSYAGVQFASADPYIIKFFLRWLQEVGRLKKNEILFDVFTVHIDHGAQLQDIAYWSHITGFNKDIFTRIYIQKSRLDTPADEAANNDAMKTKKRNRRTKIKNGILRIRVRASSMLARQMAGWITGIKEFYWQGAD